MELINERAKEIRKRVKLNQDEFAKLLGIKRCNVGSYEEGRATFPMHLIPKIMDIGLINKHDMYSFIFDADYKF